MEKTSPRWRRQHLELPQSQCVSLQGGKKKGKKKKQKFVYDTHSRPGQGRSENKVENVMRAENIRRR